MIEGMRPPTPRLDWADLLATARREGRSLGFRYHLAPDDIDDIVSMSLVKAVAASGTIDPSRNMGGWIATLVRNTAIDWLRQRRPLPTNPSPNGSGRSYVPAASLTDSPALIDPLPTPETTAVQTEMSREIVATLDRLSPIRREALIAAYWFGMSRSEMAERMGVPMSTIKSRIHRGSQEFVALWLAREGADMGIPTREAPNERETDWTVRPDKPYWAADDLPAGSRAWTDHRGGVRELAREKPAEGSQPVLVREPLPAGERAVVSSEGPGEGYQWIARRPR